MQFAKCFTSLLFALFRFSAGSTGAYTVRLATRPVGGEVTVAATSTNASTATVQPAQLRFGAGDWDAPKTFRLHGAQAGSATISHSASGADYGGAAATTVAATVRGTQAAGVRIEPPTLTLREGGERRVPGAAEHAADRGRDRDGEMVPRKCRSKYRGHAIAQIISRGIIAGYAVPLSSSCANSIPRSSPPFAG